MAKYIEYNDKVYEILGLKTKDNIDVKKVAEILKTKKIDANLVKKYFPTIKTCNCGKCSINTSTLLKYIEEHYSLYSNIPFETNYYYEYNEKPISINSLVFE
jgi:hypothetical protein